MAQTKILKEFLLPLAIMTFFGNLNEFIGQGFTLLLLLLLPELLFSLSHCFQRRQLDLLKPNGVHGLIFLREKIFLDFKLYDYFFMFGFCPKDIGKRAPRFLPLLAPPQPPKNSSF